ncbi:MAG: L-histidine N(alpha)-methyltransferase [Chloroflexi bacterium]|nr:L-histidine N(alpha)-methyltransferase [Chloroflexota bacterium]
MQVASEDRLKIEVCFDPADQAGTMADEVRRGLTATQKWLPCKYFYDETGSALFEQITELPEYYLTRTELAILQNIATPLALAHPFEEVVEIGAGSAKKTTTLLDALAAAGSLRRYLPIDVDGTMVLSCGQAMLARYPQLEVSGLVADFQKHLSRVAPARGRRLVIFLGSTFGNLNEEERQRFLAEVRPLLGPTDRFLMGIDLVKDVATLEAAYDDAAGVTAAFNRNILTVLNSALKADFDPAAYRHRAFFNRALDRIEMHLAPATAQHVVLQALDLAITVQANETIFTEISCKYTRATLEHLLAETDFSLTEWHTDPEGKFAVLLAGPR